MNLYGPFTLPYLPPFDDSWKQQCLSCLHCVITEGTQEGGGYRMLTCGKARYRTPCIEARAEGASCGPEAKGWSG